MKCRRRSTTGSHRARADGPSCARAAVRPGAASIVAPAHKAPPATAAREIEALITALGDCTCEFQRNFSGYPAKKADADLRRKYDWLRKRDLVDSAEQFNERAGSESSFSGRAYKVRCPGQATVTSAAWLRARLTQARRAPPSR